MALPAELRIKVYCHLFSGAILVSGPYGGPEDIDYDSPITPLGDFPDLDNIWGSGSLPGVLTVSKEVRNEALPVFARKLLPFFGEGAEHYIAYIPDVYLEHAAEAVLDAKFEGQVTELLLPRLRALYVRDCFGWIEDCTDPDKIPEAKLLDEFIWVIDPDDMDRVAWRGIMMRQSQK